VCARQQRPARQPTARADRERARQYGDRLCRQHDHYVVVRGYGAEISYDITVQVR
jgi:hypothetical protein